MAAADETLGKRKIKTKVKNKIKNLALHKKSNCASATKNHISNIQAKSLCRSNTK
jgi:transcription elongation factor Elf1